MPSGKVIKGLLDEIFSSKQFYRGTPAGDTAGAGKYFSGSPDYGYIQKSDFVMPAKLDVKNPYIARTQSDIERIGKNPERAKELQEQGYDAMVWLDPERPTHGRSGWGNDYSQVYVFDEGQAKSVFQKEPKGLLEDIVSEFDAKALKKAGWTPERIDRAIRDMSHIRGDVAKGRIGYVNPKQFVEATHPDYSQIKQEAGLLDIDRLRNETQIPFINVEDGKIVGHEGRHRMTAMQEAGIDSAPVMIRDVSGYSSERVPAQKVSALLEGQDLADNKVGKPLQITDTILASSGNRQAIKDLMSGSDLVYSSPIMGGTAGLMGLSAIMPDEARAAEIAATDSRDVGSIQAANHPALQKMAGLLGSIDTPFGKPFENIPNSLLAMAYGDDPDLLRSLLSASDIAP